MLIIAFLPVFSFTCVVYMTYMCMQNFFFNILQIAFSWDAAEMLIEYYHPSYLPTIDDSKSNITSEVRVYVSGILCTCTYMYIQLHNGLLLDACTSKIWVTLSIFQV